jgi:hypothetical protein
MLVRMILVVSALLMLASPGRAQECQNMGHAEREALVRKAPTCDKAHEQFSDCAYGASGDVSLADIVTEKCEAEFLPNIVRTPRWRAYQRSIKRCDDKYEKMDGTMYIAMAAGCRIDVAQSYAHKFSNAKPGNPKLGKRKPH